jgi:uncharacterized membrane protein YeaQ/YmgE (transglycosylase-associated protein family)
MNVVAWIALGGVAGYLAGVGPWGEASTGVERIVLGVVGAIVGGYVMLAVQGSDPLMAGFSLEAAAGAVILAAITVRIVATVTPGDRTSRRTPGA